MGSSLQPRAEKALVGREWQWTCQEVRMDMSRTAQEKVEVGRWYLSWIDPPEQSGGSVPLQTLLCIAEIQPERPLRS